MSNEDILNETVKQYFETGDMTAALQYLKAKVKERKHNEQASC